MTPSLNLDEGLDMSTKAWSHSRLTVFEACKFQFELKHIQRIPEPPRPLPPGKTEHANDRGTRIHEAAERYIKGGVELIPELQTFARELERARDLYALGKVSTEGEWAFNRAWEPVAWMSEDTWLRVKCDVVVDMTAEDVVVVDLKSGKKRYNELKHAEQMQLYVLSAFLKRPNARRVTTELWYTDIDDISSMTYTREQGLRLLKNFEQRGERLTSCEEFPPNPNVHSCRFCPYKPVAKGGTGHCSVGV